MIELMQMYLIGRALRDELLELPVRRHIWALVSYRAADFAGGAVTAVEGRDR